MRAGRVGAGRRARAAGCRAPQFLVAGHARGARARRRASSTTIRVEAWTWSGSPGPTARPRRRICSTRSCGRRAHVTGIIGTVETRVAGERLASSRTTPESSDLAGAAGSDARRGSLGGCAGGLEPRDRSAPRRRRALRGRGIHEPDPGPSRLPQHARGVLLGQAPAVHRLRCRGACRQHRRPARRGAGCRAVRRDHRGMDRCGIRARPQRGAFRARRALRAASPTDAFVRVALPLAGAYNVSNALVAAGCALACGIDLATVVARPRAGAAGAGTTRARRRRGQRSR